MPPGPMYLIQDLHPALTSTVQRIMTGRNKSGRQDIMDFDGCVIRVKVTLVREEATADEPKDEVSGESGGPRITRGDILIRMNHRIKWSVFDTFKNYAEVVGESFPSSDGNTYFTFDPVKKGVSITIPSTVSLPQQSKLLQNASQLRVLSFLPIFTAQAAKFTSTGEVQPMCLPYRESESLYLTSPKVSEFYVVISVCTEFDDDTLFVRNFLQSFVDTKRHDKSVSSAPGFAFVQNKAPPMVPSNLIREKQDDRTFWCMFQVAKRHVEEKEKLKELVKQLVNFRNNLMFHIHACRGGMHAEMRRRVENSLKVLARAKTQSTGKPVVTIDG